MDLLKAEMARKKSALQKARQGVIKTENKGRGSQKKYLPAAKLRQLLQDQEEAARNDTKISKQNKRKRNSDDQSGPKDAKRRTDEPQKQKDEQRVSSPLKTDKDDSHQSEIKSSKQTLSETTEKLRSLGLPVRFFGETDADRMDRLRNGQAQHEELLAHKDEFRLGEGHGIRNPFLQKEQINDMMVMNGSAAPTDTVDTANERIQDDEKTEGTDKKRDTDQNGTEGDEDPHKEIYKYFKGLLKEWESDLQTRDLTMQRSVAGRNETRTLKQCKDYIRPLFKLCKSRQLESGLLQNIYKMVQFCKEGEFVKAHDVYMDTAIGRAAWPIGVTMVGIHARTGRSKIESQNIAHVMNSELQRKYLTSVKRLITFAQSKRPDVDPSKKVMN